MEKKEDIELFEKGEQQLHSFLTEISELSKKKPDAPLNKFKLKFINDTLSKLNALLKDNRPFADFQQFDVDDLPTNSDVVVILSQYTAAVHRFRIDNTAKDRGGNWCWIVQDKTTNTPASDPRFSKYQPK